MEMNMLFRARPAKPGEEAVDGLHIERDPQAEADAERGALLAQLPQGWSIQREEDCGHSQDWTVADDDGHWVSDARTPEAALRAALESRQKETQNEKG